MISVLLTILKIIGIILLVLLSVFLIALLLILFVPVRYRAKGDYHDKETYAAEGSAAWLLHIVSAKAIYHANQPLHLRLRVFGIPIYDNLREDKRKIKNKKPKSSQAKSDKIPELKAASVTPSEDEIEETSEKIVNEDMAENVMEDLQTHHEENQNRMTRKGGFFKKIKAVVINFVHIFKNIKFTIRKIYDTMVGIKDNIRYYLKVLQLESTKQAFAACRKQLSRVFRMLCPKKFQVRLHLGFDDPSVTGEILAIWGMLYPWHQGNIDIQPDFERTVMEGDFYIKGHVSVYVLVWTAIVLVCDRNIKLLMKHLKRNN